MYPGQPPKKRVHHVHDAGSLKGHSLHIVHERQQTLGNPKQAEVKAVNWFDECGTAIWACVGYAIMIMN
jgi:hypothetical protein